MSDDINAGWGRDGWGTGAWGTTEPKLEVTITDTNSPVSAGDELTVDVEVTNVGGPGSDDVDLIIEEQE